MLSGDVTGYWLEITFGSIGIISFVFIAFVWFFGIISDDNFVVSIRIPSRVH